MKNLKTYLFLITISALICLSSQLYAATSNGNQSNISVPITSEVAQTIIPLAIAQQTQEQQQVSVEGTYGGVEGIFTVVFDGINNIVNVTFTALGL